MLEPAGAHAEVPKSVGRCAVCRRITSAFMLSELSEGVRKCENKGDSADGGYPRFQKVFSEVPPVRLLMNLSSNEMRGTGLPQGQT